MHASYVYSLFGIATLAMLLFFAALLHARNAQGLAMYCLAVAAWSSVLLLSMLPSTEQVGRRLIVTGGFVIAAYLHTAFDFTRQKRYRAVLLWYAIAAGIFLVHVLRPGFLYDAVTGRAGPLFWPAMAVASAAALGPIVELWRAHRKAAGESRPQLLGLAVAGACGYGGSAFTAITLSYGILVPVGPFVVLCSLFVLAYVVHHQQPANMRRLAERSLVSSILSGLLSATFVFGVVLLAHTSGLPGIADSKLSLFLVVCGAALAFEPAKRWILEKIGRRLLNSAHAPDLARALASQEARADQAAKLAELGTFASAVAHEVRGPLGVLKAQLRLGEGATLDRNAAAAMQLQIARAERFVEDLLRYGRPRPLQVRVNQLSPVIELAFSSARNSLDVRDEAIEMVVECVESLRVEADASQLLQVFIILFENSLLAVAAIEQPRIRAHCAMDGCVVRVTIEDNGPGIPAELMPRLFRPFVTGRRMSRDGERAGTGLGLAIARSIVERHGGTIAAGHSHLGGACLSVTLPISQPVMAAATSQP